MPTVRPVTRRALLLASSLALGGCGFVSFQRPRTDQELILRGQVRYFYSQIQLAFAEGNPDALTVLFSPSITRPMSYAEVQAWARRFFSENKTARFRILRLEIEQLGPVQAVVLLTYKVQTPDGKGDFGGTERDTLSQSGGRWSIVAWDKVAP